MSAPTHVRRTLLGLVGVAALVVPLATADPAQAAGRDSNRFSLTSQADAMFFEANSLNAPASPKNQAGSLTARVENNSSGNSTAFAGAPYFGPTVTTVPGTATGVYGGIVGSPFPVPLPFTTAPGYVSSRFPSDPSAEADGGGFRVKSTSGEFGGTATGDNGAPGAVPSPNSQQFATAKTDVRADGTVVSTATSSVKGVTVGPLTAVDAVSTATITENGNRKPTITSAASGRFSVAGMDVAFDKKGFRLLGMGVPAGDGLKALNAALANANVKLSAVPSATTVNKESGATEHLIGGLQMTTTQRSPATEPAKLDVIFARVAVSTVSVPEAAAGATEPAVGAPPAAPSDGGATPVSKDGAPAAVPAGDEPLVAGEAPVPSGEDTAAAPDLAAGAPAEAAPAGEPLPTVLGAVQPLGVPVRSESSLLYLVLVLGGVGTVLGSQLFSRYGVLLQLREGVVGGTA